MKTLLRSIVFLSAIAISSMCVAQTVYTTRTGEKYHNGACRYLSKSKIETTITEAEELGYTPCSVCKPRRSGVPHNPVRVNSEVKPVSSSQCSALTQSGKRCSRMTREKNGRCWQHQ